MILLRLSSLLTLLLIVFSTVACAQTQKPPSAANQILAIRARRMLDVAQGKLINDAVVLVENTKIVAAGAHLQIPSNAQVIDLGDSIILPGLIDAHTHITYHFDETGHFGLRGDASNAVTLKYAAENARKTLEGGITTTRNLGAGAGVDIHLRDQINRGETVGPRMIVSGEPLTANDLRGAKDAGARLELIRQFVRARIREGADVIKIFEGLDERGAPDFSTEEIRLAVEEAAVAKLKVAVHAHEAAAVKAAVAGGCASIEHGTFMDEKAVRLMVQHHTALVPTLYLPTHYLQHKKQFQFDDSTWEFFEKLKSQNLDNLRKAKKAGVWIVAGSDAVAGLHGDNAREIVWMVKAGMTPAEAIHRATVDAALLLGMENEIGEISAGKFADLIAVAGDPLSDITNLEKVEFVMKDGKIIKSKVAQTETR